MHSNHWIAKMCTTHSANSPAMGRSIGWDWQLAGQSILPPPPPPNSTATPCSAARNAVVLKNSSSSVPFCTDAWFLQSPPTTWHFSLFAAATREAAGSEACQEDQPGDGWRRHWSWYFPWWWQQIADRAAGEGDSRKHEGTLKRSEEEDLYL